MKFICAVFLWGILLVVCWPLAFLALLFLPLLWMLSIPIRLLVALVDGLIALIRALFLLPARVLGWGRS